MFKSSVRILAATAAASSLHAAAQPFTWTGPPNGFWSTPGHWTPSGPPDSATADAFLSGVPFVVLDSNHTVRTLSVADGTLLQFFTDADLVVAGPTITNDGEIRQTQTNPSSFNDLIIASPMVTITGVGEWRMDHSVQREIRAQTPGNVLVVDWESGAFGQTIRGAGNIGANSDLGIINRFVIAADNEDDQNLLILEPGTGADALNHYDLVNDTTGSIARRTDGAQVLIRNAAVLNRGVIGNLVSSGADVLVEHAQIDNTPDGVVRNLELLDGGEVRGGEWFNTGSVRANNTVEAVIGDIAMPKDLFNFGRTRFEGVLSFSTAGSNVDTAELFGPTRITAPGVILTGEGRVNVETTVSNAAPIAPSLLTIGQSMMVVGNMGSLGDNDRFGIHNFGTIESRQLGCGSPDPFIINPGSDANVSVISDFINAGTLQATDGIDIMLRNQQFVNEGEVVAQQGSNVTFESTAEVLNSVNGVLATGTWRAFGTPQDQGRIELSGSPITIIGAGAQVDLNGQGANLTAGGPSLQTSLTNNSGTLRLFDYNYTPGNSLTNNGEIQLGVGSAILSSGFIDVTQSSSGTLRVDIAGTGSDEFGRIILLNGANLDGTLEVGLAEFNPSLGDSFTIISASGGVNGTFATESLPALSAGLGWMVNYTMSQVRLEVVTDCVADVNNDGNLDHTDFTAWIMAFNNGDPAADQNGDGNIDHTDFTAWLFNFNAGC